MAAACQKQKPKFNIGKQVITTATTNLKSNIIKNTKFYFARWSFPVNAIEAMIRVKADTRWDTLIEKLKYLIGGKVTKSFIKELNLVHSKLRHIHNKNGNKGLVLYLKTCSVCLQQAVSGHRLQDLTPMSARISRTKGSKLPRIIPVKHRLIIQNNLPGNYILIKYYLTIFYLYRLISFTPKESLSTILDKGIEFDLGYFQRFMPRFILLFVKDEQLRLIPLFYMKRFYSKYFSITRSSPFSTEDTWSTHPISMMRAATALVADASI